MMNELKWRSIEEELPEKDGTYLCCNDIYQSQKEHEGIYSHQFLLHYDGYGFKVKDCEIYSPIKYWKHLRPLKKAYGKVKK